MIRSTRSAALAFCLLALLIGACGAQKSDSTLASEVDRELSESPDLAGARIEVTVQDGVVTLRGVVSRDDQRSSAESLAWSIQGVEAVESQIELASSPSAAPPAVGAGPPANAPATQ